MAEDRSKKEAEFRARRISRSNVSGAADSIAAQVMDLHRLIADARAALDTRVAALEVWRSTDEPEIDQLRGDLASAQTAIGLMSGRLLTVETDLATAQGDISGIQSDVSTLQSDVSTLQSDVSTLQSDVSTLQSDVLSIQSDIAELQKANPYALFRVAPGPNINATNPTVMPFTITSHQDTNTFTLLGSGRFRCDRAGTYLIHGGLSYQSLDPYVGLSLRISKVVPTPAVAYLGGAESLVAGGLAPISSSRFIRVIECALNDEFEASTLRHASASGAAYSVGTNTHFGFIRLGDNR